MRDLDYQSRQFSEKVSNEPVKKFIVALTPFLCSTIHIVCDNCEAMLFGVVFEKTF